MTEDEREALADRLNGALASNDVDTITQAVVREIGVAPASGTLTPYELVSAFRALGFALAVDRAAEAA